MTPNLCQSCGKRKKSFPTREAARRVARANPRYRLRAYECGGYWHLTSLDAVRTAAVREAKRGAEA